MEKHKLLTPDCLVKGEYYQQYGKDGQPYCIVVKAGNLLIRITYWESRPSIGTESYYGRYLYAKISEHSFNRIKRMVIKKLGI
ncbi:MAG: hypothetical protein WC389_22715 [Lutibacter sp.]|jgi:hypothetical protein